MILYINVFDAFFKQVIPCRPEVVFCNLHHGLVVLELSHLCDDFPLLFHGIVGLWYPFLWSQSLWCTTIIVMYNTFFQMLCDHHFADSFCTFILYIISHETCCYLYVLIFVKRLEQFHFIKFLVILFLGRTWAEVLSFMVDSSLFYFQPWSFTCTYKDLHWT